MLKVVVIDDEPLIVRDIKNSIESADEEFCVIATATDGITGLKLIQELKPNLVFIDICMSVLSGLEVISRLRYEGNMIPVVILSGYQEFDYAKKAIRLNVLDYLVKPMNPLSLKNFLEHLKEKLKLNQYEQRGQGLESIIRHNNKTQDDISILFDENEKFLLTKICFGPFNFFRNNQFASVYSYRNVISLKDLCNQKWGRDGYWLLEGKYENELILVMESKEGSDKKIRDLYNDIHEKLNQIYYITFVTTDNGKKTIDLKEELVLLEIQLYHKSIFGKSSYIIAKKEKIDEITNDIDEVDYEYIAALVTKRKKLELFNMIENILVRCEESNYTQAKLIKLLKNIIHSCCPKEVADEIDFIINLIVVNAVDYTTLHRKLCEVIIEYSDIDDKNENDDASANYVVYMVQEYLDSHYKEKVSIQNVADKFGFNCSYLCHLFRKFKNVSPNEYIIMKRIDMAKKLLKKQRDLSVKEIALIVGYEDQYYFSRLFKTYARMSPTDFRKDM